MREPEVTPEPLFLSRRELLAGAAALAASCGRGDERAMTRQNVAARYNNFLEFGGSKDVWKRVPRFPTDGWSVDVGGLVKRPRRFSVDELVRSMRPEERVYRFRCVEAWAMVIPWTGFPLSRLLALVEPRPAARYVRFLSFAQPSMQYYEGLRLDEAMHDLTLVATGIYGHALPRQHGAPIRIVVPWKYGYKSPKSIVRIELVDRQPRTFWEDMAPHEYPFQSNVNPAVPHPRWSQLTERLIGTWDVRRTEPYNGYGDRVRNLYL
ncbi:MAG TPA: protein-methionine-sulfoxide reductase catalytic subunit MsrP [Thermoanaerobaculia bacterium]|nr:protein-methionine-sulfoxide reductase catalytic subunit MsrP [Thermoanaerobaculia bacterium]